MSTTATPLQQVRMGRMESPVKECRPFAVWDGSRKVAENLTKGEALAMLAGMCWSEEGRKLGPYANGGLLKNARWTFVNEKNPL
jgi:hypothetical protein